MTASGSSSGARGEIAASLARLYTQAASSSAVVGGVSRLGSRITAVIRESALFQWLTAEPEPDVIVIDLRETWTVGPIIGLLDRVITALAAATADSRLVEGAERAVAHTRETPLRVAGGVVVGVGVALLAVGASGGDVSVPLVAAGILSCVSGAVAMRETRSVTELRETPAGETVARGGALLVRLLEPPEPPESSGTGTDDVQARLSDEPESDESLDETSEADESERTDGAGGADRTGEIDGTVEPAKADETSDEID